MNQMAEANNIDDHPGWHWCTPEGAREQVLRLGLKHTLREKLQWLEDAETLTLRLRAARGKRAPAEETGKFSNPEIKP